MLEILKRNHKLTTLYVNASLQTRYVMNQGLGGVMIWDVSTDDFNNICGYGKNPLLNAITRTLSQSESRPNHIIDNNLSINGMKIPNNNQNSILSNENKSPNKNSGKKYSKNARSWENNENIWNEGQNKNVFQQFVSNDINEPNKISNEKKSNNLPYHWMAW